MYVRVRDGAFWSMGDHDVHLSRGSVASFDTYFNTFSAGKWAQHSAVGEVAFELDLAGRFEVQSVVDHPYRSRRVVASQVVESEGGTVRLDPLALSPLAGGQLFLRLCCLSSTGTVRAMRVVTPQAPERDVRLMIVMTTFRRPEYVKANVERMLEHLAQAPELRDHLRLLIVDNGRDLEIELPEDAPVRVLPNRNLGGAGGFARGLLEARRGGWATHLLFMDDDISFHPEVVGRTLALLRYAASPKLCVSGAMLSEDEPHKQFEAGATWLPFSPYPIRAIGNDVDLSKASNLAQNDHNVPVEYGAWWFFAFPLSLASGNPLPVFVRGDDILFSLLYARPHAISVNGVAVWHQDHAYKNGPAAFYYEARNFALVSTLAVDGYDTKHLRRRFLALVMRALMSMKYDSAEAMIRGMRDFLRGPEWWLSADQEALNAVAREHEGERLGTLPENLRWMPLWQPRPAPLQQLSILLSVLTLGGHLLPASYTRRGPAAVNLQTRPITTGLWRDEIVYRYPPTGEGFVVRRDRERFFALLKETGRTCMEISRKYRRVRSRYRAAYEDMVSDQTWWRLLGMPHTDGDGHSVRNAPAEGVSA